MLTLLGKTVEKRPKSIIMIILIITMIFGSLLPAIEMGTSTEDFMPDDEIVTANQRISEYFGQSREIYMVFVEKQNAQNVVTPKAIREQYTIQKAFEDLEEIDSSIAIGTFIDMICQMEFGDTLLNCTDQQITTAYNDLMINQRTETLQVLQTNDPNEHTSEGIKKSLDIKNCQIIKNEQHYIFEISVNSLEEVDTELFPSPSNVNVTEWYISFENAIIPMFPLEIKYRISAQMACLTEIDMPKWIIGQPLRNLQKIRTLIQSPTIQQSYTLKPYIWIGLSDEGSEISFSPETANATFDFSKNKIIIEIPSKELEQFGVAPRFGSFELPAKLSNFTVGTRYYQTPNTMYMLTKRFENLQNRMFTTMLSSGAMQNLSNSDDNDFNLSSTTDNTFGFTTEWIDLDNAPDQGTSSNNFFIKPAMFEDGRSFALMFLSKDFEEEIGPSKTLMMLWLKDTYSTTDFDDMNVDSGDISKKMQQTLKNLDKEETHVSMLITGGGIISNEMNEATADANSIIMPSIFVAICLILLVMFKSFSYVLLPLVSLGISIIWLFGTMVLFGIGFNMMMVAIVPLLMGLGVDYSVHIFHNYKAELNQGKPPAKAIIASIQDVGMAIFLATLTTVIAFLSFLTAGIPPLRDFGVLCALGIIYTLITALTFQTAVRFLLDRKKTKGLISKNNNKISLDTSMDKISNFILRKSVFIFIATICITVIMASGASQVETTFDMNDFLPEGNKALELMMDIGEFFPSASESQEYILIEGNIASVETLQGISETYENLRDDEFVTKTPEGDPKEKSILSVMKQAIRDNSSLSEKYNTDSSGIPIKDADVVGFYDFLYNHLEYMSDVRSVLHRNGTFYDATVIRVYTSSFSEDEDIDSNTQYEILYNDLNEDMSSYGDAKAIVTGSSSSMYTIMGSMTESQLVSTVISILLAALILMIVFRNPLLGLITIIPVGISIVWIVGSIFFLGYTFNIMTVMVTSLNIGIGIAFGIHVTQRFRLTADRTGDVQIAVSKTVTHTGGALFIAALTTAVGFGILILAPLPPEQQFGLITAMTIIYSYFTSIFVLPPILMKWGQWQKKRKGYIISPNIIETDM